MPEKINMNHRLIIVSVILSRKLLRNKPPENASNYSAFTVIMQNNLMPCNTAAKTCPLIKVTQVIYNKLLLNRLLAIIPVWLLAHFEHQVLWIKQCHPIIEEMSDTQLNSDEALWNEEYRIPPLSFVLPYWLAMATFSRHSNYVTSSTDTALLK